MHLQSLLNKDRKEHLEERTLAYFSPPKPQLLIRRVCNSHHA